MSEPEDDDPPRLSGDEWLDRMQQGFASGTFQFKPNVFRDETPIEHQSDEKE